MDENCTKLISFARVLEDCSCVIRASVAAYSELSQTNNTLYKNNKRLEKENIDLHNETHALQQKIIQLQEENAAFSKVSHIVAMEKENARLQRELSDLKAKLVKVEPPPKQQDAEEESFYLQKIKGKQYYISEKDLSIYAMTEDEDVGEKIGVLTTAANGKKVPQWIQPMK